MEIQLKPYFAFCAESSDVLRRLFEEREGMREAALLSTIAANLPGRDPERALVDMRDRWRLVEPRDDDAGRFRLTGATRRFLAGLLRRDDLMAPSQIHAAVEDMRRRLSHARDAIADARLGDPVAELIEIGTMLSEMRSDTGRLREAVLNRVGEIRTSAGTGIRIFPVITDLWDNYCRPLMGLVSDDGDIDRTLSGMSVDLTAMLDAAEAGTELADACHDLRDDVVATRRRTLSDFQAAYREVLPLYEGGRRAARVSKGAEILIERLRRHGLDGVPFAEMLPVGGFRFNGPFRNQAAEAAMATAIAHREAPPVQVVGTAPRRVRPFDRRSVCRDVVAMLPTRDLVATIISASNDGSLSDILGVYGGLIQQARHAWWRTGRRSYEHGGRRFDAPVVAMERAP
jgi:hypothetical protein